MALDPARRPTAAQALQIPMFYDFQVPVHANAFRIADCDGFDPLMTTPLPC